MKPWVLASVLGACALLGCSPANVGGGDAGPSPDTACGDSAFARCSHFQSCSPTLMQLRYGDVTTCETVTKASCLATLAAPSTGSTVASSEACSGAIPNWDCADYIVDTNAPPECQTMAGSIATGGACDYNSQCQSTFCAIVPGAACGTCASPPSPGDMCATQLTSCGPGLLCNYESGACGAPVAKGASCIAGASCVLGTACVGLNTATGTAGTCQTAVESVGGACSSTTSECDFYAGYQCDNATKSCVAVTINGGGGNCNYVTADSQTEYCGSSQKCMASDAGVQGTCPGVAAIGAACDLAVGPGCVSPVRCITTGGGTAGTCAVPDGTACH
jgi:hypothetical protein